MRSIVILQVITSVDGIISLKTQAVFAKGRPSMIEESVERVSDTFARSPKKSVRRASRELAIPVMSVWRRLQLRPYRLQLLQALKPTDYGARAELGYRFDVCRVTKSAHIEHL